MLGEVVSIDFLELKKDLGIEILDTPGRMHACPFHVVSDKVKAPSRIFNCASLQMCRKQYCIV